MIILTKFEKSLWLQTFTDKNISYFAASYVFVKYIKPDTLVAPLFLFSWHLTEREGLFLGGGLVANACLTLETPRGCSPPGSSVHGILQARILEWGASSFSRGTSPLRNWARVSCTTGRLFPNWAMRASFLLASKTWGPCWRARKAWDACEKITRIKCYVLTTYYELEVCHWTCHRNLMTERCHSLRQWRFWGRAAGSLRLSTRERPHPPAFAQALHTGAAAPSSMAAASGRVIPYWALRSRTGQKLISGKVFTCPLFPLHSH